MELNIDLMNFIKVAKITAKYNCFLDNEIENIKPLRKVK